jgi:membrane protein
MIANVAPQLEFVPVAGQAPAAGKPGQVVVSTQARKEAVQRIQSFIENINAGALGTVGTLLLIVVAIRLMMSIEESFNDVWGVTQGRSLYKKIVYYWATITLGPLMVILAIGVTSSMEYSSLVGRLDFIPGFERAFLFIAPFVVLWISFGLMYALMPNTRVTFRAALIGGIVGGTLWQLNNLLNTIYVSRVISYSKIYGSLGMIPVVLLGLYFSWVIVLLGAQSSFVAQNLRSFMQHRASERVDEEGREFIACRVVLLACAQFLRGQPPPTFDDVGARLGVPAPLLNRVVRRLTGGGVLSETGGDLRALVPVRPPDQITLADVLHVLRTNNGVCGEVPSVSGNDMAANSLRELFLAERSSPSNARFSDLAARLGATGGAQS